VTDDNSVDRNCDEGHPLKVFVGNPYVDSHG
jgi:hypothetical protein